MQDHLIIDWKKIHLYNSLMSVMTGAGFLSIWSLFSKLNKNEKINPKGIAINFAVIGVILFITGVHTTLTWPLSPTYPFDNSAFGEPSFVFGALLLGMAFYFWKEKDSFSTLSSEVILSNIMSDFNSFKYVLIGIGLAVIMIGVAGIQYKIFIAPPEEPLAGWLEETIPYITTYLIGLTWILTGFTAIGFSIYSKTIITNTKRSLKWLYYLILILGINFLLTGVITYYSHVGMQINTMDPSTVKPNVIMNPDKKFQQHE